MAEIIKEKVTTHRLGSQAARTTEVKSVASTSQTIEYLVYFLFGALEVLLVFRLILKLLGANVASAFVALVYGLSGVFILPFEGIFRRAFAQGVETTSVLEPATIVAIVVYAVVAWGIITLIGILSGEQPSE